MSNESLRKQCKALADTLYEFSGADFSQQHVQMQCTHRIYQILAEMQSLGVLVINPDMNQGHLKGIFSGITFDNEDNMPTYLYQLAHFNGTKL